MKTNSESCAFISPSFFSGSMSRRESWFMSFSFSFAPWTSGGNTQNNPVCLWKVSTGSDGCFLSALTLKIHLTSFPHSLSSCLRLTPVKISKSRNNALPRGTALFSNYRTKLGRHKFLGRVSTIVRNYTEKNPILEYFCWIGITVIKTSYDQSVLKIKPSSFIILLVVPCYIFMSCCRGNFTTERSDEYV